MFVRPDNFQDCRWSARRPENFQACPRDMSGTSPGHFPEIGAKDQDHSLVSRLAWSAPSLTLFEKFWIGSNPRNLSEHLPTSSTFAQYHTTIIISSHLVRLFAFSSLLQFCRSEKRRDQSIGESADNAKPGGFIYKPSKPRNYSCDTTQDLHQTDS